MQSHLLLDGLGGERGYSANKYTSLSHCELRTSSFSKEREKRLFLFSRQKEESRQYSSVPVMLPLSLSFSQAFHRLVCILMGFVCFLPEGKADAKKTDRVSALAPEAVGCRSSTGAMP